MGFGVIIEIILAVIFLLLSPIIYLVFRKLGKKKLGMFLALLIALIVIIPVIFLSFESQLYFKSDAINDLEIAKITLNDDFEIIENEIIGMPEYYQTTKLEISKSDRDRIITEIKKDKKFFTSNEENFLLYSSERKESEKTFANYLFKDKYVRETYEKEKNFVPISLMIILSENSNIVELKRIED